MANALAESIGMLPPVTDASNKFMVILPSMVDASTKFMGTMTSATDALAMVTDSNNENCFF
jgi:hypothetical protein